MLDVKTRSKVIEDLKNNRTHKQIAKKHGITVNQVRNVVDTRPELKRKQPLSDPQKNRVIELLDQGMRPYQIALKLGINPAQVSYVKNKRNSTA